MSWKTLAVVCVLIAGAAIGGNWWGQRAMPQKNASGTDLITPEPKNISGQPLQERCPHFPE